MKKCTNLIIIALSLLGWHNGAQAQSSLGQLLASPKATISYADDLPYKSVDAVFGSGTSSAVTRGGEFNPGGTGSYYANAYKITLAAGQSIEILHSYNDAFLCLFDADGNLLEEDNDAGLYYGGIRYSSYIAFTATTAGDYFIVATTREPTKTGAYTLSISPRVTVAQLRAKPPKATITPSDLPKTETGTFGVGTAALVFGETDKFRTNGSNHYADAYRLILPEGERFHILHDAGSTDSYLYLYSSSGNIVAENDNGGAAHGGSAGSSYIDFTATTNTTYYIVPTTAAERSTAIGYTPAIGAYTLTVKKHLYVATIEANQTAVDALLDGDARDALAEVTLTGTIVGGGSITFKSRSWEWDESAGKYRYVPADSDLPLGYSFLEYAADNTAQVAVIYPAMTATQAVALPHSEALTIGDNAQVWSFTLAADARLNIAAEGVEGSEALRYSLYNAGRELLSLKTATAADAAQYRLPAGIYYLKLENSSKPDPLTANVSISYALAYTALDYAALTLGAPAQGTLSKEGTAPPVLTRDGEFAGAGYSFAAAAGKTYHITYTLNASSSNTMIARLHLLKGGDLQGNETDWKGDDLDAAANVTNGTSLSVSRRYTATADGNLRLLSLAEFESDEVTYTITVREVPDPLVYTALDYAPLSVGTPTQGALNKAVTVVLNPDWNAVGAGYSFAATEGKRYLLTYTLNAVTSSTMGAELILLKGGAQQGDATDWNGDWLDETFDSYLGTSLSVSFTYTATATGNLRLLALAGFECDEINYTITVTELPDPIVYTALTYTPLSLGTPAQATLSTTGTAPVRIPGVETAGVGYSFAAAAGKSYQITYTVNALTTTNLTARLCLLKGGDLQGNETGWNGDWLDETFDSYPATSLSVSLTYTATATGNLRLLARASFGSDEVTCTITVTEAPVVYTALDYAPLTVGTPAQGTLSKAGTTTVSNPEWNAVGAGYSFIAAEGKCYLLTYTLNAVARTDMRAALYLLKDGDLQGNALEWKGDRLDDKSKLIYNNTSLSVSFAYTATATGKLRLLSLADFYSDEVSYTIKVTEVPAPVVYTALDYAPLTLGAAAQGSLSTAGTAQIINPYDDAVGAGYSFAAAEGKSYLISYTVNSVTNTTMGAALILLKGGDLQGNATNWNGDRLGDKNNMSELGTSLSVTLRYTATATGTLRLLSLAFFDSDEVSYTLKLTELPDPLVYTALSYAPLTLETPAQGTLSEAGTATVLNPDASAVGAGYSFAAAAGKTYHITYTLNAATSNNMGAGLILLKGGDLQGNATDWKGDLLSYDYDDEDDDVSRTSLRLSLRYTATATGNLRLLSLAFFDSDEVSYTIKLTELPDPLVYTALSYAPLTLETPAQGSLSIAGTAPVLAPNVGDASAVGAGYSFAAAEGKSYLIRYTVNSATHTTMFAALILLKGGDLQGNATNWNGDLLGVKSNMSELGTLLSVTLRYTATATSDLRLLSLALFYSDEVSYAITVTEVPAPLVYTALDYAPLTVGTPARASLSNADTMVVRTPEGDAVGAGYSFAAAEGKTYRLTYSLNSLTSTYMTAGLFLLKGELQGNATDWNGDLLNVKGDMREQGTSLSVSLTYTATATGNLRLLCLADYYGSDELLYAIKLEEVPAPLSLPALLAGAAEIPYSSPLSFAQSGVLGSGNTALVEGNAALGFRYNGETYYADARKIEMQAGDNIRISHIRAGGFDPYLYLYKQDGTGYVMVADEGGDYGNSYINRTIAAAGTYYIVATTYYANTTGAYTLSVWNTPEPPVLSANTALASLAVNGVQATAATATAYAVTLGNEHATADIAAQPQDPLATAEVWGVEALSAGDNTAYVKVTAENGAQTIYTLTITRENPTVTVPVTLTVTFNSNGGSPISPQQLAEGATATEPPAPTREGYSFAGWNNGSTAYNFTTPVTANITLTAQWTENVATGIFDSETQSIASPQAYPNPFTESIHLKGAENSTLQVITVNGTVVHTQKLTSPDETISLEKLPAGLYFFRLEKDGKVKTLKAVKR
ncbi:hypothetical protein FACS189430_10740 [Bacteroidia bacterium]|nr:hypothetical protein FACS189430_10740 [Bacteroidia bacterium]